MRATPLSLDEEIALARAAQAGSTAAFERLLTSHLRLVFSIAQSLKKHGLPMEDLVAEGLIGLVAAARRFDPERGVRLATFATKSIRASIRRYTLAHRRIVRMPSTRAGRLVLTNLRRVQHELAQVSGGDPDPNVVAALLGVDVRHVEEIEEALSGRDVSYGPSSDGSTVAMACPDPSAEVMLGEAEERHIVGRCLERALSELSGRERSILQARHAAPGKTSLASIARDIGLSRERVRQIEQRAKTKVRHAMTSSYVSS